MEKRYVEMARHGNDPHRMASPPKVFPTTRWTLVNRVRDPDAVVREAALEELCKAYWLPLYSFARRSGQDPHKAEDAVQDFFLRALRNDLLSRANEESGKLRSFLCVAFKRHLHHQHRHETALCRGGRVEHVPLLPENAEDLYQQSVGDSGSAPDQIFQRQWARHLIERAQQDLRTSYEREGKAALFELLAPFMPYHPAQEIDPGDGVQLPNGMTTSAFRLARHRMRKRLQACIRTEVRETTQCSEPELIEAEIRALLDALSD
ncbi:MAG: RNA polymerase sigma-70 factor, ECF subfamily [Verrucomicrobia bacterium]|nr:MAG: RNA polymerase sigma-70 factor, ECF subfamily [Verrucomicrobiota bacterium]